MLTTVVVGWNVEDCSEVTLKCYTYEGCSWVKCGYLYLRWLCLGEMCVSMLNIGCTWVKCGYWDMLVAVV